MDHYRLGQLYSRARKLDEYLRLSLNKIFKYALYIKLPICTTRLVYDSLLTHTYSEAAYANYAYTFSKLERAVFLTDMTN